MIVTDFVCQRRLMFTAENDPRSTLFHVVGAAILTIALALARFKVLEAVVEDHSASFSAGDHRDVIGDAGANENCSKS